MTEYLARMYSWIAFVPKMITFTNIIEILLLSFLIYKILCWVQNTRAWTLLKGGVIILVFYLLASFLRFTTITWIINRMGLIAVLAVLIIFQPELRKALEQLGSKNILTGLFLESVRGPEGYTEKTVNEIVRAAYEMGKVKTGALIVIEKDVSLQEVEHTGIEIDGIVTSQLLINIFEHNTPLHDGAVVIRGNRITAATCYLPLTDSLTISKDLGTRHRAALGISESTDSMTVVVSEETGRVSLAQGGVLKRISDPEVLRAALTVENGEEVTTGRFKIWKGRNKNERKTE
ncbi:MAG: diadenylate cyclase CdaA [Lachnospiraceae bacterium]|jgi:diadenylate cyclase|nr:diadenylate cyclase CdaA [Lachnospiraceae bacterium]MBQ5599653.1 diadenylate cyclase CdaA [Lachnospiraceae bacterium]